MAKLCRAVLLLAGSLVAGGMAALGLQYPWLCFMVFAAAAWHRLKSWRGSGSSHGTARLAGLLDLAAGLLGESGLILGRANLAGPPTRWQALRCLLSPRIPSLLACRLAFAAFFGRADRGLIRVKDYVHLLTVAPAGAGKSVATIIPNLLGHLGSVVVLDPKGELYQATAEHRHTRLGHKIIRLDPFGLAGPAGTSDTLNPLDFIDETDPAFVDEVRTLADLFVISTGKEVDPHWNEWAVVILTAFMSFVCGCEPDASKRTLALVRDIVSSRHVYGEAMKAMQQVEGFGGLIAKFGDLLTWLVDRELASIMSSVHRHTTWMDTPQVAASLAKSSFDPRWLRRGRVSIYLILPHDKLSTLAPLMRCWLGTILRLATKHGATEKNPVLFIVDEAAHLGKMEVLQNALTLMRGYGIRIWLFFQSLDQMKVCYGEHAAVMLDNLATQQFFGINSLETADHLSKRLGDTTILVESRNGSTSTSRPNRSGSPEGAGSTTTSHGYNLAEQGRRVIRPEEWLVLPESVAVIFHKNRPPIVAEMVRYFNAPEFARGGTGRGRSLGVPALAASLLVLAASLGFAGLMLALPSPGTLRQASVASMRRVRPEAVSSRSYSVPQLTYVPPPPASRPAMQAVPEWDWDLTGRVWRRRSDGSRQLMSGPLKPGRSGR